MRQRLTSEAARQERLALTTGEAAALIGIGRSALYDIIRCGKLPARKIGARTIILREDAVAFLQALPRTCLEPTSGNLARKPTSSGLAVSPPLPPRALSARGTPVRNTKEAGR